MIRSESVAAAIGLVACVVPSWSAAQLTRADSSVVIAGVVVGNESGLPLGYSIVSVPSLGEAGRERYTTADGTFYFTGLPRGSYTLRVRHLGYAPRDIAVNASEGRTELRVELTRVAVRLTTVRVVAREDCTKPGPPDPALAPELATLFEQVAQNADRLRLLIERHPYRYVVERSFFDQFRSGETRLGRTDTVAFISSHGWRYRPGQMISVESEGATREYVLNLPSLVELADSAFVASHCFRYAGTDTIGGRTTLRIDFYAAKRLRGPDVDGAVYLDTATFQIRGARIALTRPPATPRFRSLQGMAATTLFDEVVPSVPVPSFVVGTRILRARAGIRSVVSTIETQTLLEVRFLKELPGTVAGPR
jgi:hypothetical protein